MVGRLTEDEKDLIAEYVVDKMRGAKLNSPQAYFTARAVKEALMEIRGNIANYSNHISTWLIPKVTKLLEDSHHEAILALMEENVEIIDKAVNEMGDFQRGILERMDALEKKVDRLLDAAHLLSSSPKNFVDKRRGR